MDPLRELFWLWIIIGMVFVSLVIGLIFLLINKCISKKAEQNNTNSHQTKKPEYYAQGKSYCTKDIEEDLPPLPPRTQFHSCPEADSYENLEDLPDYVKVNEEARPPPYTYTHTQQVCYDDNSVCSEDYDDVAEGVAFTMQEDEDYDDVG